MTSLNQQQELNLETFVQQHGCVAKPRATTYLFAIGSDYYSSKCECLSQEEMLKFVGRSPDDTRIVRVMHDQTFRRLAPGESVCFTEPGVERFVTIRSVCKDGGVA